MNPQEFIVATSHRLRGEARRTFDDLHDLLQMPTAQRRGNIHDACGPPLVQKPSETDFLIYSAFLSHGFHH
jgi:predicted GNAT superfamily acetyltransferase